MLQMHSSNLLRRRRVDGSSPIRRGSVPRWPCREAALYSRGVVWKIGISFVYVCALELSFRNSVEPTHTNLRKTTAPPEAEGIVKLEEVSDVSAEQTISAPSVAANADIEQVRHQTANEPTSFIIKRKEFNLPTSLLEVNEAADFDGIEYSPAPAHQRNIQDDDGQRYELEKQAQFESFQTDAHENDWANIGTESDDYNSCHKPMWTTIARPVCSIFHETAHSEAFETFSHLGSGYYRSAYLLSTDSVVLKSMNYGRDFTRGRYSSTHNEAAIMDHFTASETISNTYGVCATSIAVEPIIALPESNGKTLKDLYFSRKEGDPTFGRMKQSELEVLQNETGALSLNKSFTHLEKLEIALGIVESIAEVHGLPTGPIMVVDIQLFQWLMIANNDNSKPIQMILNDFDMSRALSWNVESKSYCKANYVGGPARPEGFGDAAVDETLDMWHVGSVLYTVLTGLLPYYDDIAEITDPGEYDGTMRTLVQEKLPYLDQRYKYRNSIIESRMLEIIERCLVADPSERASIFDVLQHLRETERLSEEQEKERIKYKF